MPGFTCCVPGCYNNNKKQRHLKFYNFPKDQEERRIWVTSIGRAGNAGKFSLFTPTTGHRVCSGHFDGGEKTYMIKRPTVFPPRESNVRPKGRRSKGSQEDEVEESTVTETASPTCTTGSGT